MREKVDWRVMFIPVRKHLRAVPKLQEAAVAELLSEATEGAEVTRVTEIEIDPSFLSNPDFLDQ